MQAEVREAVRGKLAQFVLVGLVAMHRCRAQAIIFLGLRIFKALTKVVV